MSSDGEYSPFDRRREGLCAVAGCDGPWGECDKHFHKRRCASETLGDEGCSCGLTGVKL